MTRTALHVATGAFLPLVATAALAVIGFTHDAPQFTGGSTGRTWAPLDVKADHLPAGCAAEKPADTIPAAVVVIPAHYYAQQRTVTLDQAASLQNNSNEADDVYVVGFCQ